MKFISILLCLIFCTQIVFGQTYPAPTLSCVQNAGNKNELTWHIPTVSCGAFVKYYIYHATSYNGPYTLLDSILIQNQTTYSHIGVNNNVTHYYFMTSSFSCPGATSTHSDTVDNTPIPAPRLISISIENNFPVYRWEPIVSKNNVWGYIAFTLNDKIIDTVKNKIASNFIDTSFNGQSGAYNGGLAAMDSCGSIKGVSTFFLQRTSFLSVINDPCVGTLTLSWTPYLGWDNKNSVKEYHVMISKNNQLERLVSVNTPTSNFFIYSDYIYGDTICMRIRAVHPTDSTIFSYSNSICIISKKAQKPTKLQVVDVSYNENYKTKITWYIDTNARAKSLQFDVVNTRSSGDLRNFVAQNIVNEGAGFFSCIDDAADASAQTTYTIKFEDSCNSKINGIPANSLFLDVEQVGLYANDLTWQLPLFPLDVNYTISSYDIYLSYDNTPLTLIATLPPSQKSYKHLVDNLIQTEGVFCYQLVAHYQFDTIANFLGKKFDISSQLNCVPMRSVVFIPNAFKIDGVTKTFKPKFVFWKENYFNMKIFNRWGVKVFETNDPVKGWDGMTSQGILASEDSYSYLISYKGNDNVLVNKTGNLMVFK